MLLASASALACGRHKATSFHGYCIVANQAGRNLAIVNLTHFRLQRQIPLDAVPSAVLAHPTSPKAFILAPEAGTVYELDAGALTIGRRVRVGNRLAGMQISPAGDALWVLSRDPSEIVELPLAGLQPNRRIHLPAPPDDFDLSSENQAAVASQQDSSITIASLSRGTIQRVLPVGAEPSIVRFQSNGKQLLAASRRERVLTIFDTATGKVVVRLPLPLEPRHFCFNSDGGQLFISGDGVDGVVIVFPYSTEVDQTILAGHAPDAMAVTSSPSEYLLAANPDSNSVTVLDVDTRKFVAVVQVGLEPRHIVVTPDNGSHEQYALVLNRRSGDLAVIRVRSLAERRYKSAPLFTLIPVGEEPVSAAVVSLG